MTILVLILWFMLSFVIASAASQRGRGPFGWFLLSILTTPIVAALFLLLFPLLDNAAMSTVNDRSLGQAIEQAEPSARKGFRPLIALVAIVLASVWALSNLETVNRLTPGAGVTSQISSLEPAAPNAITYEMVAAMPCVSFLDALGTSRFSEFTDPLIQVVGPRDGGLGSTANMTSYVLTECRLSESKKIGQAVDSLFEQKRRGRLPQIPIGGATQDPYVQANWVEFDNWIHHLGPRPDFSKIKGR
jgi:hypothetical protein